MNDKTHFSGLKHFLKVMGIKINKKLIKICF